MIIGGGKTGFYLAKMLSEFGAAVKVIEKSKDYFGKEQLYI